ncbi:MAG: hypothetical protein LBR26_08245 [Prevotella sp.]|jgi:hypothetical protein|nr:hypothetical protein [Prevotella sp.]
MHKTTATAGAVLRKTFTRFFGQGVSSLFFRTCIPKVNIIRPYASYRQIAGGDMENSLFVRSLFRIPIIEYRKAEICNRLSGQTKYLCCIE